LRYYTVKYKYLIQYLIIKYRYPTGLGALLVSERGAKVLQKKFYGGGTVKIAMSSENWHQKRDSLHERFEDGTIPYLSIISLLNGFKTLNTLAPTIDLEWTTMNRISRHTFQLGKYLYDRLKQLKHLNGEAVVRFYHDTTFDDVRTQGGIVNFNLMHSNGSYVGFAEVINQSSVWFCISNQILSSFR
jgi:molybdenum cofactor sulfurtransferase